MPKLDVGNVIQPYMRSKEGICRVDSSCLVEKDVRDLAEQPKKVNLLSVKKRKLAEVGYHRQSFFLYNSRVSYKNLNLLLLNSSD